VTDQNLKHRAAGQVTLTYTYFILLFANEKKGAALMFCRQKSDGR